MLGMRSWLCCMTALDKTGPAPAEADVPVLIGTVLSRHLYTLYTAALSSRILRLYDLCDDIDIIGVQPLSHASLYHSEISSDGSWHHETNSNSASRPLANRNCLDEG